MEQSFNRTRGAPRNLVLEDFIHKLGINQLEFARIAGVSPTTVSHWINNVRDPGVRDLRRLSRYTGTTLSELYDIFGIA